MAQTTPDFSPPALVTPAPLIPPFNTLSVVPGNPLRGPVSRSLGPAAFPPAIPQDGKVDLELSAKFAAEGSDIQSGLQWRVFHDETDQNGDLPLSADSTAASPRFRLNPGGYVIHAVYGLASVSKHVVVEPAAGPLREQLVVPAGAVRLLAVVGDKPIDPAQVSFKLTVNEGGVDREVADNLRAGARVRLPAGSYHVVSNFGEANAVVEVDIRVEAGKLLEATVHHKAALVALRLLDDGRQELDNTSWSVLTPGGDVVRESILPSPSLILAEGKYLAIARHDGQSFSRDFAVRAGQDQAIDIERSDAATLPAPAPSTPAEGSDSELGETGETSLD